MCDGFNILLLSYLAWIITLIISMPCFAFTSLALSQCGYDGALCNFLLAYMSNQNLGLLIGPKHFVLESGGAVT